MVYFQFRQMKAVALAAAGVFCLAASEKLVAASEATSPNVIYTATGVFASPPISGFDLFQLAGEPFSIIVVANSGAKPASYGFDWAKYTNLEMFAAITTPLVGSTPVPVPSNVAGIELSTANPSYDLFTLFAPIPGGIIGYPIDVQASIRLPHGTFPKPTIRPFSSITLGPCQLPQPPGPCVDQVSYSDPDTGATTKLGIVSGTMVANLPGQSATEARASVQLHGGGAQVITAHADGTQSMRSIGAGPVDLGASSDVVTLRFYAAGVRGGADVHVQIAGQDVPVLYAGQAKYFPGLDEINVALPRSLAGSGDADVALTVDGQTASPVHIQIQ